MIDNPKYLEQFDRVKRYYQRLQEIGSGRVHDRASDFYDDDFLAYFMNCYHLKDWIKNDDSLPEEIKSDVEKFIKDHQCFLYCADIANGAKHLKLDGRRRIKEDIKKGTRNIIIQLFEGIKSKPPFINLNSFLIPPYNLEHPAISE